MKPFVSRCFLRLTTLILACATSGQLYAASITIRVVTYNIEDDINGATAPLPGLIAPPGGTVQQGGVLEGIGEETVAGDAGQPLDILALEETTSNSATVAPIVNGLNAYYGVSNMYAMSGYQATESGGDVGDGNGPNAIVYNTKTVQLINSIPVDPAGGTGNLGSSSGEYREVMCYVFAPAAISNPTTNNEFYIYVSHYKSGTTSSDLTSRGKEAVIVRNHAASNWGTNARILYVGDYNVTTSGEVSYQTIISNVAPNGIASGQGIDFSNVTGSTNVNWGTSSLLAVKTESATSLRYRDDFQIMTTNVYYGTAGGLALVSNTYHVFGNNGSVAYQGNIGVGNTALNSSIPTNAPISAANLYYYLTNASDHLPVVADYTLPVPDPAPTASFNATPTNGAAPLSVTFTDTSSGGITNHSWIFGDGGTTNTTNLTVVYIYNTAGVYSVTETVSGSGGSSTNRQANLITVLTPYQAWQLQYFGCTNCSQAQTNADADGTGQNNLFKFVAGLNPTNPASVFTFSVSSVTNQPNWKNLKFNPVMAGRTYIPQFKTSLSSGTWQTLTSIANPPITNGTQVTLTDTNAINSQEFYRLNITLP